jgi:hypothetical protein
MAASRGFVAEVGRSLAMDGLDATQIYLGRGEQPHAPAKQLRHDVQHHLVDSHVYRRLPNRTLVKRQRRDMKPGSNTDTPIPVADASL